MNWILAAIAVAYYLFVLVILWHFIVVLNSSCKNLQIFTSQKRKDVKFLRLLFVAHLNLFKQKPVVKTNAWHIFLYTLLTPLKLICLLHLIFIGECLTLEI